MRLEIERLGAPNEPGEHAVIGGNMTCAKCGGEVVRVGDEGLLAVARAFAYFEADEAGVFGDGISKMRAAYKALPTAVRAMLETTP